MHTFKFERASVLTGIQQLPDGDLLLHLARGPKVRIPETHLSIIKAAELIDTSVTVVDFGHVPAGKSPTHAIVGVDNLLYRLQSHLFLDFMGKPIAA